MNNWICIKTRLPEINQKVLFHWVLTDSFGVPSVKNVSMGYRCSEGWNIYLPYHSFGLRADVCPVTHWMEIPELPKTEDKFSGAVIIDDPFCPTAEESEEYGRAKAKEFIEKLMKDHNQVFDRLGKR